MKRFIFILIGIIGFMASGCTTSSAPKYSPCLYTVDSALQLRGNITPALVECVKAGDPQTIKTLVVNMPGGNVDSAIEIAELLPASLEIIIEGECNSSCANYFLPLAETITLRPRSMILLHGSIDAGFVESQKGAIDEATQAKLAMTAFKQANFLRKHNIHPGWILKRTAREYESQIAGQYIVMNGSQNSVELGNHPAILVNEMLLKSCLPNIIINGLDGSLANLDTLRQLEARKGQKINAYVSGDLICKPMNVTAFYRNTP